MKKRIVTFAVMAGIFLLQPMAAHAKSDMSSLNRNRKAIGRALLEMQAGNWESLLQYYTEDIEYQDSIVRIEGIDMVVQFLDGLFLDSPNPLTTVEDEICINGMYTATWTSAT